MASQLTSKEQRNELDDIFKALDQDHDGTVSKAELEEGLKKFFGMDVTQNQV